jgi:hypothetical protein
MTPVIGSVLETGLATVLFIAALGKVTSWRSWLRTRDHLRVGIPSALWKGLPVLESAVGIGLALGLRPCAELSCFALFVLFAVVLAIANSRGATGDCNCFGEILPMQIGLPAIGRALAFAALAALLLGSDDASRGQGVLTLAISTTIASIFSLSSAVWTTVRQPR